MFRGVMALVVLGADLGCAAPLADQTDRLVQFADSLMLQQRFRESELEYERFVATHPDDPERLAILRRMFDAAMASQDYTFTLKLARAWENKIDASTTCLPAIYEGHALYQLGNYPAVLRQPLPASCNSDLTNQNRYLRGLSLMRLRQWPQARQEFDRIPEDSALHSQAQLAAQKSLSGPGIPQKSPFLAASLNAVLPGAGYGYANRPQTAVACFVVNGLFIWGTVASVHAKEPGLAALLSLFSFGWYWGGVYGAAQAAQKETQSHLAAFIGPLELTH